jgi:hypothetical protein
VSYRSLASGLLVFVMSNCGGGGMYWLCGGDGGW